MPEFDDFHAGLCRPLLTQMSEFAGHWTYERPQTDADLARSNRCRHTTLAPGAARLLVVKTRAFDGRDVDGTEQPVSVVTAPLP